MTKGHSPPFARRALAALAIALSLAGCIVDVDLDGSRLVCTDGRCPSGFDCVGDRCVPTGQGESDASPPIDAGPPDAGPADGAPPDAAIQASCDDQYGSAPDYVLCAEEPDRCQFFLFTEVAATCDEHCLAIGGGDCLTAHNADSAGKADPCELQKETSCEAPNSSQVCVCARGPAR
jgi:hypothetical protein